ERLRVTAWLDDDPYPRAEVEPWLDDGDPADPTGTAAALDDAIQAVRQALAWHAELGDAAAPATIELSDAPQLASFPLAAIGPFRRADRQSLLEEPGTPARLARLHALAMEDLDYLRMRLDMDNGEDPAT